MSHNKPQWERRGKWNWQSQGSPYIVPSPRLRFHVVQHDIGDHRSPVSLPPKGYCCPLTLFLVNLVPRALDMAQPSTGVMG